MALNHAKPGEPVSITPLGTKLAGAETTTIVKTPTLEVIRLVVHADKEIPTHQVSGEVTVQCLEGKVVFRAGDAERQLTSGQLLYLEGGAQHSLRAEEDSSLLVTILLK